MTFPDGSPTRRRLVPHDLQIVQQASALITDLSDELDRRLAAEARPSERLRMFRETTNRIIRTANDAALAYARASRAVTAELRRPNPNVPLANQVRARLIEARTEVLGAIEEARRRHPPSDPTSDRSNGSGATP